MIAMWMLAVVLACGLACAAGRTDDVPLGLTERAWERKVFPPKGVSEEEAATLAIVEDAAHGPCLSVGPWRQGEWSARFQYAEALPFTHGVLRGYYRTEGLPLFGARVSIEFRAQGQRVAAKSVELEAAPDWRPFSLAFRLPPPGADSVSPGLGLSAQTEGRVLFAQLTLSPQAPPFAWPATPTKLTRPQPPTEFPAAGFYRLAQHLGTWWLVTPEGKPCYSLGTDGPWFRSDAQRDTAGPAAAELLERTGFNSLAGWTDVRAWGKLNEDRIAQGKRPFAVFHAMETGGWEGRCDQLLDAEGRTTGKGHAFPDPFDPRFEVEYRKAVRRVAEVVRGKSWFVGYFADNEISHGELYRHVYSPHCATALRDFLAARYGEDIGPLNAAWGTSYASFDALLAAKPEPPKQGTMYDDLRAFARVIVARYADTTRRLLREEDPDHLAISNRFMLGDVTAWMDYLDLYAPFDLLAVNLYPSNQTAGLSETEQHLYRLVHERTGKPVIVGEWSVPAADSGLYDNPGKLDWSWNELVATQAERARQAACVTADFYNLPFVVGSHWFIWQDIGNDKRQANRGLMKANGEPWTELIEALRGAHARLAAAQEDH
jgi:hypothetical protein